MERVIYNALFSVQCDNGRGIRYFCPLEGKRHVYAKDSFCCPNNFRRIMAELPMMVYYKSDNGIVVNLYTNSEADIETATDLSVNIQQKTDYPTSGKIIITVNPQRPAKFSIKLRIPRWCTKSPTITVNGEKLDGNIEIGSFYSINRTWQSADKIELDMPMEWRVIEGRKLQAGKVAIMRGPQVFCLSPERNKNLNKGIDIGSGIIIDTTSLDTPVSDDSVRPGGVACKVKAWSPNRATTQKPDLNLLLTELPDPTGQFTYFQIPNQPIGDELTNIVLE